MPNTRPAAPGGAALRTSMSREGSIMPLRKPASPMPTTSAGAGRLSTVISSVTTAATPKPAAATSPWRCVRSASEPPASTPTAPNAR